MPIRRLQVGLGVTALSSTPYTFKYKVTSKFKHTSNRAVRCDVAGRFMSPLASSPQQPINGQPPISAPILAEQNMLS